MNSSQLNFAPYQPPPEAGPSQPRTTSSYHNPSSSYQSSYHSGAPIASSSTGFGSHAAAAGGDGIDWSNPGTSSTLGRYDWEGAAAYAFGPIGAAVLLVLEVENDWVRFAAWQSALLSAGLILLHLCLIPLGAVLEVILLLIDIVLFAWLSRRTYQDADLLDRFKLPFIGDIAQKWVEDE